MRIAIIDYGAGNLTSVERALTHVGADAEITASLSDALAADGVVLPGVGAAADTMRTSKRGLVEPCARTSRAAPRSSASAWGSRRCSHRRRATGSDASMSSRARPPDRGRCEGAAHGLEHGRSARAPHLRRNPRGASSTSCTATSHPDDRSIVLGETEYGEPFPSVIAHDNLVATQFHPEKSGETASTSTRTSWDGRRSTPGKRPAPKRVTFESSQQSTSVAAAASASSRATTPRRPSTATPSRWRAMGVARRAPPPHRRPRWARTGPPVNHDVMEGSAGGDLPVEVGGGFAAPGRSAATCGAARVNIGTRRCAMTCCAKRRATGRRASSCRSTRARGRHHTAGRRRERARRGAHRADGRSRRAPRHGHRYQRDGMLRPNFAALEQLVAAGPRSSPRVGSRRSSTCSLAALGCEGVIVGKALYEGARPAARSPLGARRMLTSRIIPCFDVDNGRVVKGVSFVELRDAGDPVELAKLYEQRAPTSSSSSISPPRPTTARPCTTWSPRRRPGVHPVHRRRRHSHRRTT